MPSSGWRMGLGAAAEAPRARPDVGVGAGAAAFVGGGGDESSPTEVSAFAANALEHILRLVNRRKTQLNGLNILAHDESLLRIRLLEDNKRVSLFRRIRYSCDSQCSELPTPKDVNVTPSCNATRLVLGAGGDANTGIFTSVLYTDCVPDAGILCSLDQSARAWICRQIFFVR